MINITNKQTNNQTCRQYQKWAYRHSKRARRVCFSGDSSSLNGCRITHWDVMARYGVDDSSSSSSIRQRITATLHAGLWSRSRRLGLETYQRLVSVSSRAKFSTSRSRLGLELLRLVPIPIWNLVWRRHIRICWNLGSLFSGKSLNCCHQMSDLKDKMHQNRFRQLTTISATSGVYTAPLSPLAGYKGSYF